VQAGQPNLLVYVRVTAAILLTICAVAFASDTRPSSTASALTAAKATRPDIIFVQAATFSDRGGSQRFPEGSRIVRLHAQTIHAVPQGLTPEFFAAADPQVDFNAARILFSGQRTRGDKWQVWEMDADGSHKRQVTRCTEDCLRPGYLPGDEIVFTVGQKDDYSESYLAVANIDGSNLHRITFSPGDWWFQTVLRDGRILASASWPLSAVATVTGPRLLYTLRPDGAAMDSFRCDHQAPSVREDAQELEDGSIIFISTPVHPSQTGGELTEIQRGALAENKIGSAGAFYLSPRPYFQNQLIVARRTSQRTGAPERFALYSFDLQKRLIGPVIYGDPRLSSIQAVALAPHPVPKRFWSTLNLESQVGYFISLDSYSSAEAPNGRVASPIAQVRVITHRSGEDQERILGQAPVEKDGSFYVEVPADQPVHFELLDGGGQVIVAEKSWIWARPGEQRGCTGCHGDKGLAPENRWPMTLKRFDTPTHLDKTENASSAKAN
jgi:Hydrazine synthase alpha subunit middle domain